MDQAKPNSELTEAIEVIAKHRFLEGTPPGQYLARLAKTIRQARTETQSADEREAQPRPGVSLIMRTAGNRLCLLEEALLTVESQTDDDFDVLLAVHCPTSEEAKLVAKKLSEHFDYFPKAFKKRWQIIPVSGGGRSRPLNEMLKRATGKMIAFLDDDDLLFPNHIELINAAASKTATPVIVQTFCAVRTVKGLGTDPTNPFPYATEGYARTYQQPFQMVGQLNHNNVPLCSMAIPRWSCSSYV